VPRIAPTIGVAATLPAIITPEVNVAP